jgi:predicted Zn-ribbon and HTH transcriptional regulator
VKTNKERMISLLTEFQQLMKKETALKALQHTLKSSDNVGLSAELHVNGDTFSLEEVSGVTKEGLYQSFEEEFSLYIDYLVQKNEGEIENLLASVTWNEETPEEINTPTLEEKTNGTPTPSLIEDLIGEYLLDAIINPGSLYDELYNRVENLTLSDIHQVCRRYVEEDKMRLVHSATCHKCTAGYHQDYERLPKDVTCGDCGREIVNIEIQYKKLF